MMKLTLLFLLLSNAWAADKGIVDAGRDLRVEVRNSANSLQALKAGLNAERSRVPAVPEIASELSGLRSDLIRADRELEAALKVLANHQDCAGMTLARWKTTFAAEDRLLGVLHGLKTALTRSARLQRLPEKSKSGDLSSYRKKHSASLSRITKRLDAALRDGAFATIGRASRGIRQSECRDAAHTHAAEDIQPAARESKGGPGAARSARGNTREYSKGEVALNKALETQARKYPTGERVLSALKVLPHVRIEELESANAHYRDKESGHKVLGDTDEVVFNSKLLIGKLGHYDKKAAAKLETADDLRAYLGENPKAAEFLARNIDSTYIHEATHGKQYQAMDELDVGFYHAGKYPVAAEWEAFDNKWRLIHEKALEDPTFLKDPGASNGEVASYLGYMVDRDEDMEDVAARYGENVLLPNSKHLPKKVKTYYTDWENETDDWWTAHETEGFNNACLHYSKRYCDRADPKEACKTYKEYCTEKEEIVKKVPPVIKADPPVKPPAKKEGLLKKAWKWLFG